MVIGHQKQLDFLYQATLGGRLSHAYIFSGPSKVGKKTVALEWLSHCFSTNLREGRAHPDFSFVAPLADPKTGILNKEIEIGQIRKLIEKLQLKPSSAPFKAAIIDQAHLMNIEAQNALLKTLEEPLGYAVIILIADNATRLLPTIVSRSVVMKFHFVAKPQMEKLAKVKNLAADESRLKLMLDLSLGRPGRLIDFGANAGELDDWLAKLREFERAVSAGASDRFAYIKKVTDDKSGEDVNELLELWQYYFRQKMLGALAPAEASKKQAADSPFVFTKNLQKKDPLEKIAANLEKINDLIMLLSYANINVRLALENLMLEI